MSAQWLISPSKSILSVVVSTLFTLIYTFYNTNFHMTPVRMSNLISLRKHHEKMSVDLAVERMLGHLRGNKYTFSWCVFLMNIFYGNQIRRKGSTYGNFLEDVLGHITKYQEKSSLVLYKKKNILYLFFYLFTLITPMEETGLHADSYIARSFPCRQTNTKTNNDNPTIGGSIMEFHL